MNINTLYDSGAVRRFHTVADYSGGLNQTVADHSWGVALLAFELATRMNLRSMMLVKAALLHDAEEAYVGDLPAPSKWRFPALAAEMEKAEKTVRGELGVGDHSLNSDELSILKWADGLELYAYAQRRARDGARAYEAIVDNIKSYMLTRLPQWSAALELLKEMTL